MTAIQRLPRVGKALAAGALLGLVGCHQVPSRLDPASIRSWGHDPGAGGGQITAAQEADVQISLGRVAERQGDLEQAMAAYRAALSRDSRRADAYLRLAILHDQQGKFRESADLYRKALALRPGDAEIFCDMGYSLYLQRRWAEAETNLKQAIAVDPDLQRAHNNLALLLMRDNRREEALAEFRKGGSSPAQAHMNLAFALTMDQRWESARGEYERALALDPASQVANERLGQLKALIAKREKPRKATPPPTSVLTTAVDGPSPRQESPTARAATAASPEVSGPVSRPQPPRDPRVLATAAHVKSRPRTTFRLDPPSLPADETDLAEFWSKVDQDDAIRPRPRPATPVATAPPPPEPGGAHPEAGAARPVIPPPAGRSAGQVPDPSPSRAGNASRTILPPPGTSRPIAIDRKAASQPPQFPSTSASAPRPVKKVPATSPGGSDRIARGPAPMQPTRGPSKDESPRPDPADAPPPLP